MPPPPRSTKLIKTLYMLGTKLGPEKIEQASRKFYLYKRVDMSMVSLKDRMTPFNGAGISTDHIHMSGNSYKPTSSKNAAPDQGIHISQRMLYQKVNKNEKMPLNIPKIGDRLVLLIRVGKYIRLKWVNLSELYNPITLTAY